MHLSNGTESFSEQSQKWNTSCPELNTFNSTWEKKKKNCIDILQSGLGHKGILKVLWLLWTTVRAVIHKWRKHGTEVILARKGQPCKWLTRMWECVAPHPQSYRITQNKMSSTAGLTCSWFSNNKETRLHFRKIDPFRGICGWPRKKENLLEDVGLCTSGSQIWWWKCDSLEMQL